jgi:NADPH2:quinone reductase
VKAIRVHRAGDPEVLGIEDVPEPVPGPGEVLIRVRAAGVNPVDTYLRAGTHGYRPEVPYTPGKDAAGVVAAVGEGISRVRPGERVYAAGSLSGTYAEFALCAETQVHPLPPPVTFAQGAGLGVPYAAAYRALFQRAHAAAGECVLVHGATGGVGIAAVQWARAAGLRVIGSAGEVAGQRLVAEQGAHEVVDHADPDHWTRVLELTSGRGVDLLLEMLANVNLGPDLRVLAPGGRAVVIGSRGPVEIDPRDLMQREASVLGLMLARATEGETRATHAALVAGLESGALRPVVGQEMPLAQAPEAHRLVTTWAGYGKIVLVP